MMTQIQFDAAQLTQATQQLVNVKANLHNSFSSMTTTVRSKLAYWNSSAGSIALSMLTQLQQVGAARDDVLQNYINFLQQQVNPSYQNTEAGNRKLADKFK